MLSATLLLWSLAFFIDCIEDFIPSCTFGKWPSTPGIVGRETCPMWFLDRKSQDLFPRKPEIFSPLISVSELFMAERSGPAQPLKKFNFTWSFNAPTGQTNPFEVQTAVA